MKVRTSGAVTTLLLFVHVCLATHYKAKYREEIILKTDCMKEESFIACVCHGQKKRIDIRKKDRERVYEKLQRFGFCELKNKKICSMYRNCESCSFHMVDCQSNAVIYNKYDCQMKSFANSEKSIFYLNKDYRANRRRYKKAARICTLPNNGSTYDVICRKYSTYIKCQQRCILGYTLKTGLSGKRRCIYKENMWKPRGFKECQPFIDCELTLTKPGFLECQTASTNSFPSCDVRCEPFEGKSATPMETFECRITGAWVPSEIPFCVKPKGGKELVPPPKIDFYSFQEDLLRFQEDDESKTRTIR